MNTLVAPSILASDWSRFGEEIKAVSDAGADWIHIDVMDGHFVPPITFGPGVVAAAKKATKAKLDVHLMIENPEAHIDAFASAGADIITVHQEATPHLHRTVQRIHELGAKAGIAVNPSTSIESIEPLLVDIDLVLVMTVNPGWGGQSFIQSMDAKIKKAASMIAASGRSIHLEVDGGINESSGKVCTAAGADVLVAGTYVFGSDNYKSRIESLR